MHSSSSFSKELCVCSVCCGCCFIWWASVGGCYVTILMQHQHSDGGVSINMETDTSPVLCWRVESGLQVLVFLLFFGIIFIIYHCIIFSPELKTNSAVGHLWRAGEHRLLWQRGRGDGDVWAEWDATHASRRGDGRRGDGLRGRLGLVSRGAGRFLWDLPIAAPPPPNPPSPCILDYTTLEPTVLCEWWTVAFSPLCIVAVPLSRPLKMNL